MHMHKYFMIKFILLFLFFFVIIFYIFKIIYNIESEEESEDSKSESEGGIKFLAKIKKGDLFMLVYNVNVGLPGANDVVERKMTVMVNDVVVDEKSYSGDVVDLGEISVEENSNVKLSLIDIDNVGNTSEPAVFEFVALDTIAPPAPGSFGVTLVREE